MPLEHRAERFQKLIAAGIVRASIFSCLLKNCAEDI